MLVAVLICTPNYRSKAIREQAGGVQREFDQIVHRSESDTGFKVIPVLCAATGTTQRLHLRHAVRLRASTREFDITGTQSSPQSLMGQCRARLSTVFSVEPGPCRERGQPAHEQRPDPRGFTSQEVILLLRSHNSLAADRDGPATGWTRSSRPKWYPSSTGYLCRLRILDPEVPPGRVLLENCRDSKRSCTNLRISIALELTPFRNPG